MNVLLHIARATKANAVVARGRICMPSFSHAQALRRFVPASATQHFTRSRIRPLGVAHITLGEAFGKPISDPFGHITSEVGYPKRASIIGVRTHPRDTVSINGVCVWFTVARALWCRSTISPGIL